MLPGARNASDGSGGVARNIYRQARVFLLGDSIACPLTLSSASQPIASPRLGRFYFPLRSSDAPLRCETRDSNTRFGSAWLSAIGSELSGHRQLSSAN
jgi:hypothetical protein